MEGDEQTIAIVDALDDPTAEADLAVYRAQYGLSACTSANGCFRKVDQRGGTAYPRPDKGWAGEIALDLDMVSAAAPHAHPAG
jgi:subtilase family serine protease